MEGYEYKQFTVNLAAPEADTEAREGYVLARVATLNVPDNEDDVLMSDSVGRQDIIVSKWNHSSKQIFGPSPVGMGRVYEEGDALLAEMQYFIDDNNPDAESAYNTVKKLSKNNQCYWSIAYKTREADYKQLTDDGVVRVIRYIHRMDVDEASPVDDPGGVGTGTIDIKQARPNFYKQRMYEKRLESHKKWLAYYNT